MATRANSPEGSGLLTPEAFAGLLHVSRETIARFQTYARLLQKWNPAINLVSRDSLADLWRRHFLDSAQIAAFIPIDRPITILDLGSGAGFPGLVLAILAVEPWRDWTVHLVESDSRKATFLSTVARETGAKPIIHNQRVEKLVPFPVDIVTARALASLDKLLIYAAPFLKSDTECLFLKGVGVEDELTATHKTWKMSIDRSPSRSGPTGVVLRLRDVSRV